MSPRLLEAIRVEAKSAVWASGVRLATAGAAALERRQGAEFVFRVKAPGRAVATTVFLTPDDDWECSCDGVTSPCEHIVAAAITFAREGVAAPTTAARWTRLAYRFRREGDGLGVQRELVNPDGTRQPLEAPLVSLLASGKTSSLQLESGDLTADTWLSRPRRGPLPAAQLEGLLKLLAPSRNITFEGREVAFSDEVVFPCASVRDDGDDVVVRIEANPRVSEVVAAGVARCDDVLCPLGATDITGPFLAALPTEKRYAPRELSVLKLEVLPRLARRMDVSVQSSRLPRIDRSLVPRIELKLTTIPDGAEVLPLLVYGQPAHARVDGAELKHLQGALPLRDEAKEAQLVRDLRETFDLVPGRRTTFRGSDAAQFVSRLRNFRGELVGEAREVLGQAVQLMPSLSMQATSADGSSRVSASVQFRSPDGIEAPAAAVLAAWRGGLNVVSLENGSWAQLPAAWLSQHGEKVALLLAARNDDGTVAAHSLPALSLLAESLDAPAPPELGALLPLVQGFTGIESGPVPAQLESILRPYQRRGVDWLHFLRRAGLGGILADDMGLGKTLQAICALSGRTLVVCPASVISVWQEQLARYRPELSVATYHGSARVLTSAQVTLTTYAILRLDVEALRVVNWATLVLDEAQSIKNPDSQVARAAYQLSAGFRLAITGTPLENRLEELWSLVHFTNRGLLGGRRQFADSAASLELVRSKVAPILLRRLKAEVAPELPPRTEYVRPVTLEEGERAVYDAVLAATRADVVAKLDAGSGTMAVLEALLRLRQAACHRALVPGQVATHSSKVSSLMEALETLVAEGHKALVFSQWTSLLDLVEPALTAHGFPFLRLDGTVKDRASVVRAFEGEGGPPVLLLSLKVGGVGLTLTAADHVFLLDPWWNPAVEAQAADRAHRIGQTRPVFIHRMVSVGTVEERILTLQDSKRALVAAALDGGNAATGLTRDDLLGLLAPL